MISWLMRWLGYEKHYTHVGPPYGVIGRWKKVRK